MDKNDTWPPLPDGVEGQEIRNRRMVPIGGGEHTRLGRCEPKVIVAETDEFVIWRWYSPDGNTSGEKCTLRDGFDVEFERRPDRVAELSRIIADALNELEGCCGFNVMLEDNRVRIDPELGRGEAIVEWDGMRSSWEAVSS